jgi:hypothetical protein
MNDRSDEYIARLKCMGTITPSFDINEGYVIYTFESTVGFRVVKRVQVSASNTLAIILRDVKHRLWQECN